MIFVQIPKTNQLKSNLTYGHNQPSKHRTDNIHIRHQTYSKIEPSFEFTQTASLIDVPKNSVRKSLSTREKFPKLAAAEKTAALQRPRMETDRAALPRVTLSPHLRLLSNRRAATELLFPPRPPQNRDIENRYFFLRSARTCVTYMVP